MKCCIEGCGRPVRLRGICAAHYDRLRTGRDMSVPIRAVVRTGSDLDRIKSKALVDAITGCWNWQASINTNGYGQFRFRGRPFQAHRVSWILHFGEIPERGGRSLNVLHRCDNPRCINPDHLFLGDQSENAADSVKKRRWGRRGVPGEEHGRAVVSEDDVRSIRASTDSVRAIAARYGLSASAVQHIRKRRSWKHVE